MTRHEHITRFGKLILSVIIAWIAFAMSCGAWATVVAAPGEDPPPEAILACDGLAQGVHCTIDTPDGQTIIGTCRLIDGQVACVPNDGPPPDNTPRAPTPTRPTQPTPTDQAPISPMPTQQAQSTPLPSTTTDGYKIVDTAQNACYDNEQQITCPNQGTAFYGQDGQVYGNQPSYTMSADGLTVHDHVTGLTWTQSPDLDDDGDIDIDDKLSAAEAPAFLATLNARNYGGYSDWRIPSIKELYSLMDFRGIDPNPMGTDTTGLVPYIDSDYFAFGYGDMAAGERIIDAQFLSTSQYVGTVMNGQTAIFGLNLADGRIKGYPSTKEQYVYFCRGNSAYGENAFASNGDGTVTDHATGLMWSQDDSGSGMTWEEALAWAQAANSQGYLGYDDWRLPNAKELHSIVDYSRSPDTTGSASIDPVLNATQITNVNGEADYGFYWSSTTHLSQNGSAGHGVYIAFGRGLGSMDGTHVIDVHGAGCQRSDPKTGDEADYPSWGHGPQGDLQRVFNMVRLVRDAESAASTPTPSVTATATEPGPDPTVTPSGTPTRRPTSGSQDHRVYLPLIIKGREAIEAIATPTPSATSPTRPTTPPTAAPTAGTGGGYLLLAPLDDTNTYLIDKEGEIAYRWPGAHRPGNAVYLLENGNLLRTGKTSSRHFDTGGVGGIVQEIAPDGTVMWSYTHDGAQGRLHHDIEPLPNGNVLMIAWELVTASEALAAGRDPLLLTSGELWPDTIIEVNPETNEIVWEWRMWDHLVQDYDTTKANYGVVADHPELIDLNYCGPSTRAGIADWNHSNSIDYSPKYDQILLSVRNCSEIWVIDHSTTIAEAAGHRGGDQGKGGDLLYRWGNPVAYDGGTADDQQLFVQHDAQWIADGSPGAGNILVFNNGTGRSDGDYSTVNEIVPPVDANGAYSGYGPAAPSWTFRGDPATSFYAPNISGAQRLPDGNTLICDGPNAYLFEVTATGETVWEYEHGSQHIFRGTRYASDYAGLPF